MLDICTTVALSIDRRRAGRYQRARGLVIDQFSEAETEITLGTDIHAPPCWLVSTACLLVLIRHHLARHIHRGKE